MSEEEEEEAGATEREGHLAAEEDEEEGTNNDSEEVERMLMPGAEDADVSRPLLPSDIVRDADGNLT